MKKERPRHFASDNYAGVCPEAWQALEKANRDHQPAYGEDPWSVKACDMIREVFETDCEVFFVFNGTSANSLSLAAMCQSYHSILCHDFAHVERDECGAPEFFSNGTKVQLIEGPNGKIQPDAVEAMVRRRTDVHYPKPKVISVTQATEMGTCYTVDELEALGCRAKHLGLTLHMDGARFANAVAQLGVAPKALTWQAGVDVLCLGGTKNGSAIGDAVVFFNRRLAHEFDYRCKQAGQLASKMRYLSAPWVGMLQNGVWLKHAAHANAMAALMHELLSPVEGIEILFPRQANSVFVEMPKSLIRYLHDLGWKFYAFIGEKGCRLMCSWDTTPDDVRSFVEDLKEGLQSTSGQS
ncbi:MAG: low specificity L-threonine aldolase [Verrucomicrobiales bacterium]